MLIDFYGVEPAFPLSTHLITRCLDSEMPKRLYYVSDGLLKVGVWGHLMGLGLKSFNGRKVLGLKGFKGGKALGLKGSRGVKL